MFAVSAEFGRPGDPPGAVERVQFWPLSACSFGLRRSTEQPESLAVLTHDQPPSALRVLTDVVGDAAEGAVNGTGFVGEGRLGLNSGGAQHSRPEGGFYGKGVKAAGGFAQGLLDVMVPLALSISSEGLSSGT